MTRRSLLLLPFLPVALIEPEDSVPPEKAFVDNWNAWARVVAESQKTGGIDARELRLWRLVKESWSKLRPKIDQMYG